MISTSYTVFKVFVLFSSVGEIHGAKILGIFPVAAKSHAAFTSSMMKSLLSAGHEVVLVGPFRTVDADNFTSIDSSQHTSIYVSKSNIQHLVEYSALGRLKFINDLEKNHCRNIFNLKEIQEMLKRDGNQFDVMFVEILTLYHCFLPLAQKLKIPVIGVVAQRSWLYSDLVMNNPNNPSFVPSIMRPYWRSDSFTERLINVWNYLLKIFFKIIFIEKLDEVSGLHPSLIFINSHSTILSRPMNPNMIEIGGIHIQKDKPLSQELEKFISQSNGVILFSFGSIAKGSTISNETLRAFVQAFAEIPQRVIWKYEDKIENLPENVIILDWLPQRDILAHEKVVAFISHCGLNGVYEAIHSATPIIAIPLVGDQPSNAAILEKLGVAKYLDINSLNKKKIIHAIQSVVNRPKYKVNMKELSLRFRDRPITPQESVLYWTEYVIKYKGAQHMQPIRLLWFQSCLLDVLSFVFLILCILYFVILKLTKNVITLNSHYKKWFSDP